MNKTESDKFLKSIGENIRRTRILKGYKNIENFANLVMMNKDYYGAIERGQQNFTIQKLINIAEILGVPLEQFFMANPEEVSIKFTISKNNLESAHHLIEKFKKVMKIE